MLALHQPRISIPPLTPATGCRYIVIRSSAYKTVPLQDEAVAHLVLKDTRYENLKLLVMIDKETVDYEIAM